MSIKDKIAIVTGSAMGIGKAAALKLAQAGAKMILADIDEIALQETAREINELGGEALPVRVDLLKSSDINNLFQTAISNYGRLDILVNVAGVVQSIPFLSITPEEWDRVLNINLRGTFLCIQAAAAQMLSQIPSGEREISDPPYSNGKIVNFSSISGRRGRAVQAHYAASKAGIISITQSAALAFAQYNINVNAIAPSVVMTPMWEKNVQDKSKIFGIDANKASDDFISNIPFNRPGTGLDMAEAVVFLCTDGSDYITGQTLNVDGGYEMN